MDPVITEFVKAVLGPTLTGGGVLTFYLLYRRFEAERATSLREDNKTLREERTEREEKLRKAEETIDELRKQLRGDPG